MIEQLIKKIFGDPSEKKVQEITKLIQKIHAAEKKYEDFSLDDVKNKTAEFKSKFEGLDFQNENDSEKIKSILDEIKIDAFAIHKTACKIMNGNSYETTNGETLEWNMIPYDVQLIGGLAIHSGAISEMKTGE
jgi:preprotein translocase subunit SecA